MNFMGMLTTVGCLIAVNLTFASDVEVPIGYETDVIQISNTEAESGAAARAPLRNR